MYVFYVKAFLVETKMEQMDKNLPGGITAQGDALRWVGFLI
jgi:hypothetical protein